ncbi:CRISPR-associated helicase/endonuclease Cas3 [Levilactobacillus spicheri]|uniref:CRISPR-associated helicase/endonuclease Cas3 n=1 Tax=Levilactobacillus spicheri TaxID=216463 RepID=UPI0007053FD1|nr:CRISPR-associated helicase/endonuclease Cas3 [Levilactobacillus spicheri]
MTPSLLAATLWAKKRTEEGSQQWLPLIVHLNDTQQVINWLFNHWLVEGQKRLLRQCLTDEALQRLIKFLGFSHDLGKATPAFQTKKSFEGDKSLDHELLEKLIRAGYRGLNCLDLASANKSPHARAGEALLYDQGVPESICAIVGGHHGKPESRGPYDQIDTYTANFLQADKNQKTQQRWQRVQKELFTYGLRSSGYQSVTEIPTVGQPEAVLLEGLLIMADWLASSEYLDDQQKIPMFPLIGLDQDWQDLNLTARYQQAITAWNLDGRWVSAQVDPQRIYQERWGFDPRPVQAQMTAAIGAAIDPGLAIIEAPMGMGKTELALASVEQWAYTTGRNGLFMGLPTQATTNAMFDRVTGWLKKLNPTGQPFEVALTHGKYRYNLSYQKLPRAIGVYETADDQAGGVVVNSWFRGKKAMLAEFAIGTIDNLLRMGLKQKHLFLRHLGFSQKVVVIDEVHAYDAYMNQYLYKALQWLGVYHVPVVILSATLPKDKRNELVKAYLRGKYGAKYHHFLEAPDGWQEATAYPLLSLIDGPKLTQVTDFSKKSDRELLKVRVQRFSGDDAAVIQSVLTQLKDGGIAGVIVNTVKRAQALAQLIPDDVPVMLLHSAFLATDRAAQERTIQTAIGKNAHRPEKLVVIGTQVLEQSLDIDFDILYTDIAPMDLLLQRVGRLHRHSLTRPAALRQPQLVVLGTADPADYGDANEAIYGRYLLMKTDHFLGQTLAIPDDISRLVQQVYDATTDTAIPNIDAARDAFETALEQEKKKAKVFQIDSPKTRPQATIHGWLDRSPKFRGTNYEEQANAAVRDIRETIEVILVQRTRQGVCLLDGRPLGGTESSEIAQQTLRLPVAVTPQIAAAIQELETATAHNFANWQADPWLRGSLALILNREGVATLGKWRLTYSRQLGLRYEKEDDHGSKL